MADEESRITKTGPGTVKKKNAFQKLISNFIQEDMAAYEDKIIKKLSTSIKKLISDAVDMYLFGEERADKVSGNPKVGTTMISYSNMFNGGKKKIEERKPEFNYADIGRFIVPSKSDAEDCIAQMMEVEANYHMVRVPDLYEYFHEESPRTLVGYGWHDFGSSKVRPLNDGTWEIIPPQMELLQTK